MFLFLFKFLFQDVDDILDGLVLEVSPSGNVFRIECENALGSVAADGLETLDNPRVNLVAELAEKYILLLASVILAVLRKLSPNLDLTAYEHACKLDVASALAESLLDLLREHEYLDFVLLALSHID